jgi:hypothetical protein
MIDLRHAWRSLVRMPVLASDIVSVAFATLLASAAA